MSAPHTLAASSPLALHEGRTVFGWPYSLVYAIVNGTCPPIPEERYDARLAALVARLLDRDAARRPTVRQAGGGLRTTTRTKI